MMADLAACERTETQFRELLASVGLTVVKFWYPEDSVDGVIEAVLDDEGPVKTNGIHTNR